VISVRGEPEKNARHHLSSGIHDAFDGYGEPRWDGFERNPTPGASKRAVRLTRRESTVDGFIRRHAERSVRVRVYAFKDYVRVVMITYERGKVMTVDLVMNKCY